MSVATPKLRKSRNTLDRRLKFQLLGQLPGRAGLVNRRRYRRLFREEHEAAFKRALEDCRGLPAVDVGANMGIYANIMAQYDGPVYAFEPDPWTAGKLRENLSECHNVTIHEAAAGIEEGTIQLFRRVGFDENRERNSVAASTVAEKKNLNHDAAIDVPLIDLIGFLEQLDSDIGVLKIDIEGAEVALLERLLKEHVLKRIHYVFCETHETMIPELVDRTEALRKRVRKIERPVFNMDWN